MVDSDDELVLTPDLIETVTEELEAIAQLVFDADECDVLCGGVTDRLEALWGELQASSDDDVFIHHRAVPRLRDAIARCKDYITHHSGKKLLQRLAASRSAAESARLFHEEIDAFYRLLGRDEPPAWEDQWEEDRAEQQTQVGELVDNAYQDLGADLTPKLLTEVLYNLQYELARPHPEAHAARLAKTLGLVVAARKSDAEADPLPSWYIPSYDVLCAELFDFGSFGDVLRGTWAGARVVVKQLLATDDDAKRAFAQETTVWAPLAHANVVRLVGACHVSEKLFFVSEDATGGNFRDYFAVTKRGFWRLFSEAARGLRYLHAHAIMHGDLKCNNLLVGADGAAKICDFGYSYVRLRSVGLSAVAQTQVAYWKAPECIGGDTSAFKPRRESDVYGLAMCIIEAMTGASPWGGDMTVDSSEEGIRDRLKANGGYPRPDGVFTDEQWALVEAMARPEYTARMPLDEAIEALEQLAAAEEAP